MNTIEIDHDGRRLVGNEWILPQDFLEADIEAGRLPTLKGITPPELPGLEPTES